MKRLSDYSGWQKQTSVSEQLTGSTASDLITPIPEINTEALEQLRRMQAQTAKDPFYYKQPQPLPGISACEAALDECLRRYGIISSKLWISGDRMKEVIDDMLKRYKSRFNGFIPYLYSAPSPDGQVVWQIKAVSVFMDSNIYEDHVICTLS